MARTSANLQSAPDTSDINNRNRFDTAPREEQPARKPLFKEAIALDGHPEAGLSGDLTPTMLAGGLPDLQPLIDTLTEAICGTGPGVVHARRADVRRATSDALAMAQPGARLQLDAMTRLVRAAAADYADYIKGAQVVEAAPWPEARAMAAQARQTLDALATSFDPAPVAKALAAQGKSPPVDTLCKTRWNRLRLWAEP